MVGVLKNQTLTGVPELNTLIFSYLDLTSLNAVSRCNKNTYDTYNNTTLWKSLVDRDFGVSEYKPVYETYQQQYKYLKSGDPMYDRESGECSGAGWWDTGKFSLEHRRIRTAIRDNHLDVLKMLLEQGYSPDQEIVDSAALHNKYEVLFMLYTYNILPSQQGINKMNNVIPSEMFDIDDDLQAAVIENGEAPLHSYAPLLRSKNKVHEALLQLYRKKGLIPDSEEVILAAREGDLDKLKDMADKGYYPRQEAAIGAARKGHLRVLEWIYDNTNPKVLPSQEGFNKAVEKEYIEVVGWLEAKGMVPDNKTAEIIIEMGSLHLLQWAVSRGVEITQRLANIAALEGQLNMLRWMSERPTPVLPQHSYVPQMRNKNNRHQIIDMVDWMVEKGIIDNEIATNFYMTSDAYCLNAWHKKRKTIPNTEGATYAARNGHTDVLMWLIPKGILPEQKGMDDAVKNGHRVTAEYLYSQGYRPSQKAIDLCVYFAPNAWVDKDRIPPSLKLAKWFSKQDPPIRPSLNAVADDIRYDPYPEPLGNWLLVNKVIDEFPICAGPEIGEPNWNPLNMDFPEWEDSFPYKIDQNIVDDLAIDGQLDLLEQLVEDEWLPSLDCLDYVEDEKVRKFILEEHEQEV